MSDKDYLSALGDDLLRRILYFVPFKEAASTSVLSRRWRSLWRSSGAVNLDVRVREEGYRSNNYLNSAQREKAFFARRDAFVRAAEAALDAAADARVTRLTLRVEDEVPKGGNATYEFLHADSRGHWSAKRDVVGGLLSHPAARHVEELRVAAANGREGATSLYNEMEEEAEEPSYNHNLCHARPSACWTSPGASAAASRHRPPRAASPSRVWRPCGCGAAP
ncbi:unnamed protein product [Urochloa humidicola]